MASPEAAEVAEAVAAAVRVRRAIRTLVAAALLAALALALLVGVASAASTVTRFSVEAWIRQDGSVLVSERRVVDLDEDSTSYDLTIFHRGASPPDVLSVAGPGGEFALHTPTAGTEPEPRTYTVEKLGERTVVRLHFRKRTGQTGLAAVYGVADGVAAWGDANRIYALMDEMQPGMPRPRVRVLITEKLFEPSPQAADGESAPLIEIDPAFVTAVRRWLALSFAVLAPSVALGFALVRFVRLSRPQEPRSSGARDVSAQVLGPAVVGALFGIGRPESVEIAATLCDLIERGVLLLEFEESSDGMRSDIRLEIQKAHVVPMSEFERDLVNVVFFRFFGERVLRLTALSDRIMRPAVARAYRAARARWSHLLERELVATGLVERASLRDQVTGGILGISVAVCGLAPLIAVGMWGALLWSVSAGALVALLYSSARRLTPEGSVVRKEYVGLRESFITRSHGSEWPVTPGQAMVLAAEFGVLPQTLETAREDALASTRVWDTDGVFERLRIAFDRLNRAAGMPLRARAIVSTRRSLARLVDAREDSS